jgi:hypothetical protein
MPQKEEIYARELYKELKNEFPGKQNFFSKLIGKTRNKSKSDFDISLKEEGTQSGCSISIESRKCTIHCIDIDRNDLQYKGPEFYLSFLEEGKTIANGRTFDRYKTIDAIKYWLQNETIEKLYSQFSFVEQEKRQLEKIRIEINISNPQLIKISQNEVVKESFSYSLYFKQKNRSCRIYYYGYESHPRYIFSWDDSQMFEASGSDTIRLGSLISKWVFDLKMPSVLKTEFSEIESGKLSEYYERGNGIIGEFILSWDFIEDFYRDSDLDKKSEILSLIQLMREKGFDRIFRAGQSLYTLVLSRSRRHGLQKSQGRILFSFDFIASAMEIRSKNGERIAFERIEYNDTIENILKELESENID